MISHVRTLCAFLVTLMSFVATGLGQEKDDNQATGTNRALIICGHPGDDEHRAMYAETIEKLHSALATKLGFQKENIWVQFGSEPTREDQTAITNARGLATRIEIEKDVKEIKNTIGSNDTLWVIVIGHAHYDGQKSYLNLVKEDIHQDDFAKLFDGLKCREQVFFITTSVSGFFVRPLSAKGRVVISATEADLEVNETIFHSSLAEVLTNPPEMEYFDVNGDDKLTIFDLYISVTKHIADQYVNDELLSTEHAQLDDNSDGRGTEIQLDYLTVEQGGRAEDGSTPPKLRPNSDGFFSNTVELNFVQPDNLTEEGNETEE